MKIDFSINFVDISFLYTYIDISINGGESRIWTHGPLARTTVFKTVAFNHSAISPLVSNYLFQITQAIISFFKWISSENYIWFFFIAENLILKHIYPNIFSNAFNPYYMEINLLVRFFSNFNFHWFIQKIIYNIF